jgi:hypothetical protein
MDDLMLGILPLPAPPRIHSHTCARQLCHTHRCAGRRRHDTHGPARQADAGQQFEHTGLAPQLVTDHHGGGQAVQLLDSVKRGHRSMAAHCR